MEEPYPGFASNDYMPRLYYETLYRALLPPQKGTATRLDTSIYQ